MEDPLRSTILATQWRGILVEPVPYLFKQLREGYAACGDRLIFENVAIANQTGVLPFFHLAPVANPEAESLPHWYSGLGSFRREVVASHASAIPDIEERIVERDVEAITFDTLCEKHDLKSLDILHMDTEGYDYQLLQSIDFQRHRPRLVIYEHVHLEPENESAAARYMEEHGYECMQDFMDTWCLNIRDIDKKDRRLFKLWRQLQKQRKKDAG